MIRIAFWEAASGKMCKVSEREQAWLPRDSINNTGETQWWLKYSWELWDRDKWMRCVHCIYIKQTPYCEIWMLF